MLRITFVHIEKKMFGVSLRHTHTRHIQLLKFYRSDYETLAAKTLKHAEKHVVIYKWYASIFVVGFELFTHITPKL